MNIQTKVTILFAGLTITVILLLSGFIFLFANHYAFEDFYQRLETRVRIAQSIHFNREHANSQVIQQMRQQYLEKLPSEKEYFLELSSPDHPDVARPKEIPKALIEEILANGISRFRHDNKFFVGNLYQDDSPPTIIIVSATDPYGLQELEHLRNILIIGFLASILVMFLAGKFFTYQIFKPVRDLIRNVQNISAENLHLRLQNIQGKDEISMLGHTFNDMLTRLETAFETQNNFVSNASHELRTPLTIIKGEAELALSHPGLSEVHRQSVQVILQESDKLTHMLTGLLGLAQSGFDGKKQNWEIVRTDELLWMVKETVDQLYPENNVRIDFSQLPEDENMLKVNGNMTLLKLAISNIVINACKYSSNQPVTISLSGNSKQVMVQVKDKGIGIPEKELPHVFEPFFRASNTSKFEGYGVGLPLSMNIIRLHKGSINIYTKEGQGTDMHITLPIADLHPHSRGKASHTTVHS
ncbi:HAMP domain-containing histidine kinase [Rhodocytophaga rosea]|uniref:histidine kinase n=1 Tax=Rhodocytophaga rosea TaxID=2704465 RepID=A0A6C0GGQ2_9BACT|nr:HAMP domain-containing sensor histidine kinase [Rhodocytophaga rosea]QHT67055.1 HAMP domain-containing histidine kinase [Rhodocytophaga rosea]